MKSLLVSNCVKYLEEISVSISGGLFLDCINMDNLSVLYSLPFLCFQVTNTFIRRSTKVFLK